MVSIAGWSSPVARQAHNLKVVRFKSHSRTQLKDHPKGWFFSWVKEFGE